MPKFSNFSLMKDKIIHVRVSSSTFSAISSVSSSLGISVSEYIRYCIAFARKNKKDFQKFLKKDKEKYRTLKNNKES